MVEGIKDLVNLLEERLGWPGRWLGNAALVMACLAIISFGVYWTRRELIAPIQLLIESSGDDDLVIKVAGNAALWLVSITASVSAYVWASKRFLSSKERKLNENRRQLEERMDEICLRLEERMDEESRQLEERMDEESRQLEEMGKVSEEQRQSMEKMKEMKSELTGMVDELNSVMDEFESRQNKAT